MACETKKLLNVPLAIILAAGLLSAIIFSGKPHISTDDTGVVSDQNSLTAEYKGWGVLEPNVGPRHFQGKVVLDFYATFTDGNDDSRLSKTKWWVHVVAADLKMIADQGNESAVLLIRKGVMDERLNRMYASDAVLLVPKGKEKQWVERITDITKD